MSIKSNLKNTTAPTKLTASQSGKLCEAAINQVRKVGTAAEQAIHNATKLVIRHAEMFHDVDKAKKLVQALSEVMPGYATNQLIVFIEKHSPIKFQYDDTKTKIVGVKEEKDIKTGELKRPYASNETLDAAPMKEEKAVRDQGNRQIEPWSFKMYKDRLGSLEQQIVKAAEPGGRGLLGLRNGSPTTLHKGDEGFDEVYNSLMNAVRENRKNFDSILTLVGKGTPAADAGNAANETKTPTVTKLNAKKAEAGTPAGKTARKAA